MFVEEQTICNQCKLQYSDNNPPRLLTMCGHTFCEKCIRQLMSKKKMNNKYRLTCPIDKMATELGSPNPTVFPKNLSVLNLVRKKFQNSQTSRRLSVLSKGKSESAVSKGSILVLDSQMAINVNSKQRQEEKKEILKDQIFQEVHHNTCLLHQKPLELVCTRDFQKICSSCVIFGEHRGHNVKNIHEVEEIVQTLKQTFKMILKESTKCFLRLESKQMQKTIQTKLQKKKIELGKQISKRFQKLKQQIVQIEKKTMGVLDKRIQEYRGKLEESLSQKKAIRQKYQDWQSNLHEKILMLTEDNQENKIRTALKSESFLQISERNLELFKYIQSDFLQESQKQLQNLTLIYDQEELNKYLRSYCKFEDCNNSFLQMNASRITQITHLLHQEEILLDDIQDPVVNTLLAQESRGSFFGNKLERSGIVSQIRPLEASTVSSNILESAGSKLNRIKSSGKQFTKDNRFFLSPNRKSSDLKSSRVMMGSQRSFLHGMLRSKQIPEKYEQRIQAILNGASDTLDLTNGELSNEKVSAIIEHIKDSPVTIVKLVRNKLTDECIIKSIPYLNNVVMLNVSRNELTEKSIQFLLNFRKEGGLRSLKSLMIGQNKIIERKNKEMLDEFRRMGVNICN